MARRESSSVGTPTGLFESLAPRPLADRLRPRSIAEIVGQDHLLGPGGPIGRMIASGRLSSMVLWGPPGCGKTTLARLLAAMFEFDPRMSADFLTIERRELLRFDRSKLYDITGWSIPMLFDVDCFTLASGLPAGAQRVNPSVAAAAPAVANDATTVAFLLNGADDRWFVRAFVQNLTDNNAITGQYVTDQSSGLYTNIFTLEPRRYGVAAGIKF